MARGRREKRKITVQGEQYRWVLSPDDGYLILWVSLLNRPGQRLQAVLKYHDGWVATNPGARRSTGQLRAVTPRAVRAVILAGLARGWQPSATDTAIFRMLDADDLLPPVDPGVTPGDR